MIFDIKENLKNLPETPGVYMHRDEASNVIYVGKAVNLKRRVSQYFQSSRNHDPKVRAMVKNISYFEYISCQSEMEALILECNLIKKYEPKYNILLRDDKTYPYIKVTVSEDFPRLLKTRRYKKDGSKYFGPFSDVKAVNNIIELLNNIFSLKRCSMREFPLGFKPCLNYHINACKGICNNKVEKYEYNEYILKVLDFLGGKHKEVLDFVKKKMEECAEELRFEEAAKYRNYINDIKSLSETQRVSIVGNEDMDIILSVGRGEAGAIVLFLVRDGKLSGRETFDLKAQLDDQEDNRVEEFIKQYYSRWEISPKEILIEKPIKNVELIEEYLENYSSGRKVKVHVPQKGDKKALLDMAKRDVVELAKTLDIKLKTLNEKEERLRDFLEKLTGKKKDIYRVESYDISNTNGVDTVGAMVVFNNFKPAKKDYRRFKIKTIEGQDDYGSLRELLSRRFKRALEKSQGFSTLPDVILMDGGFGQVTSCLKVLKELNLKIPVYGMAKDDHHRTRALVDVTGEEINLKNEPFAFKYCGTIQEEVHRFAIEYHRNLRSKSVIGSVLDNITGIGPKKRQALLSYFKSVDKIKEAGKDELMKVEGITEKNALEIIEYFS